MLNQQCVSADGHRTVGQNLHAHRKAHAPLRLVIGEPVCVACKMPDIGDDQIARRNARGGKPFVVKYRLMPELAGKPDLKRTRGFTHDMVDKDIVRKTRKTLRRNAHAVPSVMRKNDAA